MPTLNLSEAARLIWDGQEVDAIYRGGTRLWSLPPFELLDGGVEGALWQPRALRHLRADTAGTVPAAVGDKVARLNAIAGGVDHDLVQATVASQPVAAADHLLVAPSFMDGAGTRTLPLTGWYLAAAVMVPAAGGATGNVRLFGIGATSTTHFQINIRGSGAGAAAILGASLRYAGGTLYSASRNNAYTFGVPFIVEAWHDDDADVLSVFDGAVQTNAAAPAVDTPATWRASIASGSTVPHRLYGGALIRGVPTLAQRMRVRRWLSAISGAAA